MHDKVKPGSQDGDVEYVEFPWLAAIGIIANAPTEQHWTCTGVVINDRVVVTSA